MYISASRLITILLALVIIAGCFFPGNTLSLPSTISQLDSANRLFGSVRTDQNCSSSSPVISADCKKGADRNGDFTNIIYMANLAYVIPLLAVVLLVFGKPRVLFGLACLVIVAVVPHAVFTELFAAMKAGGNPIYLAALGMVKTEPGWLDFVTVGDFLIMAASLGLILQGGPPQWG